MNFGEVIKREIVSKNIKDKHCKKAFIAGMIRGSGTLYEKDGEVNLAFKCFDENTSLVVTDYLKSLFNYDVREITISEDRLNKKDKFELVISGEEGVDLLTELEIFCELDGDLVVNFDFYGKTTERECCLKSFLRGLFLSSGVCLVPDAREKTSTKYHLELVFSHSEPASTTAGILIKNGINCKILRRKDSFVLYLKSAEQIKDFIAFIGAPVSVLKLTDLMINKELLNDVNRKMNCDYNNLNKQIEASEKQIEAINFIEREKGLSSLKPTLMEVATARRNYPDETLLELAERLNITKSCLNHRLRKIVEIANELKGNTNGWVRTLTRPYWI